MGSLFRVGVCRFDEAPRPWIALVPAAERPLWEIELVEPVTFVLGAEREGLPPEIVARCDETASIPLAGGVDSLNVAVAGALALYELRRRAA